MNFYLLTSAIDPDQISTYLQDCLDWGVQAGMKATGFLAGMSILVYMFKN